MYENDTGGELDQHGVRRGPDGQPLQLRQPWAEHWKQQVN